MTSTHFTVGCRLRHGKNPAGISANTLLTGKAKLLPSTDPRSAQWMKRSLSKSQIEEPQALGRRVPASNTAPCIIVDSHGRVPRFSRGILQLGYLPALCYHNGLFANIVEPGERLWRFRSRCGPC